MKRFTIALGSEDVKHLDAMVKDYESPHQFIKRIVRSEIKRLWEAGDYTESDKEFFERIPSVRDISKAHFQ